MSRNKSLIRKKLEKINLSHEIVSFTLKEIAERYNTSIRIVHSVLTEQLEGNKPKQINELDSGYEERFINAIGTGDWMLSSERNSLREYLKISHN